MPQYTCGGLRTTCGNQFFSSSTMQILRIELKSSGRAASTFSTLNPLADPMVNSLNTIYADCNIKARLNRKVLIK